MSVWNRRLRVASRSRRAAAICRSRVSPSAPGCRDSRGRGGASAIQPRRSTGGIGRQLPQRIQNGEFLIGIAPDVRHLPADRRAVGQFRQGGERLTDCFPGLIEYIAVLPLTGAFVRAHGSLRATQGQRSCESAVRES